MKKIVVSTGAGMSAESGLSTFRDAGGLWDKYPVMEVASAEGFARNPALIHQFYNERRRELMKIRSMRRDDRIYDLTPDNLETSTETLDKYGDHVRPHIVFFNEDVPNITRAIELAGEADIFVVIGTSLNVYPAASLLHFVKAGTPIYYIDPHPAHVEVPNLTVIAKKATEGVAELLGILSVRG